MSRRQERRLELILGLTIIAALSSLAGARAAASSTAIILGQDAGGSGLDLNVASLLVAVAALVTGAVGYLRLRTERPKIVAEVASLDEERRRSNEARLQAALDAAWEEAERLRQARDRLRSELEGALSRIAELERREDELEARIRELESHS